ncbi:MAG: hypothetical protein IT462_00390 [Planctomycetes bacterium]|nr:hypothetical protein [Planctomycetota bacterium]
MKYLLLGICALLLAACPTQGSTTTRRPALDKPAIEPDGTFWDAVAAAEAGDARRFQYLLSVRFMHESIMPDMPRNFGKTAEDAEKEELRLTEELKPHAERQRKLAAGYMKMLQDRIAGNFVECEAPVYQIQYRGDYNLARGPNHARLTVTFRVKREPPKGVPAEPHSLTVLFVQDYEMWRIDGFEPDPLKGAFSR